jgi:ABC-type uncharacterized transport system permease subunit
MLMSLSGMDLVTGKTIEMRDPFSGKIQRQRIEAVPYAGIALGCAVLGVLAGFWKIGSARVANAMAGGLGAILLILMKVSFNQKLLHEGQGMIIVYYQFGFWSALMVFVAALLASMYLFWEWYTMSDVNQSKM